jgi:hypothetical protein
MHHYSYSWGKESDNEFTYLPYCLEVTVKLPAAAIWQEWVQSLTDHTKCWLWPTQFSQPKVPDLPLREGGGFMLTYQMPNYKDPTGPKMDLTYDYVMLEWKPQKMFCRYEGKGRHPFRGGGSVSVKAIDEESCKFVWEGRYRYKTGTKGMEGMASQSARYFNDFLIKAAENILRKTGQ